MKKRNFSWWTEERLDKVVALMKSRVDKKEIAAQVKTTPSILATVMGRKLRKEAVDYGYLSPRPTPQAFKGRSKQRSTPEPLVFEYGGVRISVEAIAGNIFDN